VEKGPAVFMNICTSHFQKILNAHESMQRIRCGGREGRRERGREGVCVNIRTSHFRKILKAHESMQRIR